MDFETDCSCGRTVAVPEGRAGLTVTCACGSSFRAPSLKELRLRAGLPAYNVPPEVVIPRMLLDGELPGTKVCPRCGKATEEVVQIVAQCERKWVRNKGGSGPSAVAYYLFLGLFGLLIYYFFGAPGEDGELVGSDKTLVLPLPLCAGCRPGPFNGPGTLKRYLRTVPIYNELLEKFPSAVVRLQAK